MSDEDSLTKKITDLLIWSDYGNWDFRSLRVNVDLNFTSVEFEVSINCRLSFEDWKIVEF